MWLIKCFLLHRFCGASIFWVCICVYSFMISEGVREIYSFDKHFDNFEDVKRLPNLPTTIGEKRTKAEAQPILSNGIYCLFLFRFVLKG